MILTIAPPPVLFLTFSNRVEYPILFLCNLRPWLNPLKKDFHCFSDPACFFKNILILFTHSEFHLSVNAAALNIPKFVRLTGYKKNLYSRFNSWFSTSEKFKCLLFSLTYSQIFFLFNIFITSTAFSWISSSSTLSCKSELTNQHSFLYPVIDQWFFL